MVLHIHFCKKGVKTGARVYQKSVLKPLVKPLSDSLFEGIDWASDWPSASPDFNPLDYGLWCILEERACKKRHTNVESLKRSIVKAAAEISLETIRTCIEQWPERLRRCIENERYFNNKMPSPGGELYDHVLNEEPDDYVNQRQCRRCSPKPKRCPNKGIEILSKTRCNSSALQLIALAIGIALVFGLYQSYGHYWTETASVERPQEVPEYCPYCLFVKKIKFSICHGPCVRRNVQLERCNWLRAAVNTGLNFSNTPMKTCYTHD
ncbi:Hypothetical protein CINCED_3A000239 [Cinara cedri]|uniref:Uncharacterized protein n=1 Tax=Cinara cedri TaxID=506608 RepID=A0A5E4M4H4_9HEMI|nr:Hypothetical protein CINCED_3A000239 [Cinara cedri]